MAIARLQGEPWVGIIDTDSAVRDSVAEVIVLEGVEAREFETGSRFLTHLDVPDCQLLSGVVCAADLADGNGVLVFRELAARNIQVPFVLLVSRHRQSQVSAARSAGVRRVLTKPVMHPGRLLEYLSIRSKSLA